MKSTTMLGLGALLALLLLASLWLVSDGVSSEAPQAPTEEPRAAPVLPPAAVVAAPPSSESPRTAAASSALPAAAVLEGEDEHLPRITRGKVRGRLGWAPRGAPLAGATIVAVRALPDTVVVNDVEARDETPPLRRRDLFLGESAPTDAGGLFEFAIPDVGAPVALLALAPDTGACLDVRPLQPTPAPGQTAELGEWLLIERGELRGRVVDADGRPVRGARVRCVDVPVDGKAALLPMARAARLWGARDFEPGCLLRNQNGTVVSLSSALLARDELLPFPTSTSDAEGKFVLRAARPGAATVLVQHDAHPNSAVAVLVRSAETTEVGVVQLARGGAVGLLFERREQGDARPLAGAEVALGDIDASVFAPPVITDRQGRFVAPKLEHPPKQLPSASVRLRADQGWEFATVRFSEQGLVVVVSAPRQIRISLVSAEGPVLPGAWVELRGQRRFGEGYDARERLRAVTPSEHVGAIRPAYGLLVAVAPGFAPFVTHGGGLNETLILKVRTQPVALCARDPAGVPVARATVYVRPRNGRTEEPGQMWRALRPGLVRLGETDPRGELHCDGLWPATFDCVVAHPDHGTSELLLVVQRGIERYDLPIGRNSRGRLLGVLTERGLPPTQRWVVAAWREEHRIERTTLAEADGSFAFAALPAGVWTLGIKPREGVISSRWVPPYSSFASKSVRGAHVVGVPAGGEVYTTCEIQEWIKAEHRPLVAGRVRIDGQPGQGLVVQGWHDESETKVRERLSQLRSSPPPRQDPRTIELAEMRTARLLAELQRVAGGLCVDLTVADAQGKFALAHPDVQRIDVVGEDGGFEQRLWSGPAASAASIELTTAPISFEVTDARGERLSGCMANAIGRGPLAGVRLQAVIDRHGQFTLQRAPRGEYVLQVQGRSGAALPFAVPTFTVPSAELVVRAL